MSKIIDFCDKLAKKQNKGTWDKSKIWMSPKTHELTQFRPFITEGVCLERVISAQVPDGIGRILLKGKYLGEIQLVPKLALVETDKPDGLTFV